MKILIRLKIVIKIFMHLLHKAAAVKKVKLTNKLNWFEAVKNNYLKYRYVLLYPSPAVTISASRKKCWRKLKQTDYKKGYYRISEGYRDGNCNIFILSLQPETYELCRKKKSSKNNARRPQILGEQKSHHRSHLFLLCALVENKIITSLKK